MNNEVMLHASILELRRKFSVFVDGVCSALNKEFRKPFTDVNVFSFKGDNGLVIRINNREIIIDESGEVCAAGTYLGGDMTQESESE